MELKYKIGYKFMESNLLYEIAKIDEDDDELPYHCCYDKDNKKYHWFSQDDITNLKEYIEPKKEDVILPDYMKLPKMKNGAFSDEEFKRALKEELESGKAVLVTEEDVMCNCCEPSEKDSIVHSPSHYTQGEIETIDYIKDTLTPEEFKGYIKGNVIKYISRELLKGQEVDLQKAEWYLHYLNTGEK